MFLKALRNDEDFLNFFCAQLLHRAPITDIDQNLEKWEKEWLFVMWAKYPTLELIKRALDEEEKEKTEGEGILEEQPLLDKLTEWHGENADKIKEEIRKELRAKKNG